MNEDLKVDRIGDHLEGKNIALCVTGGIAAITTPMLARHLRRYGANVKVYMTSAATQFIGEIPLQWATEQKVVTDLSGDSEHICQEDLVLVAPATTNTVNKIFAGLADNTVTTLIASALGMGKPVYLAPTAHESLYNNPILQRNLGMAEEYGINIIQPRVGEGKAKIPKLDSIVAEVCRGLSSHPIKGKKILVTGGPTPVWIDDVRQVTNRFKGSLGKRIAVEAYLRGAEVRYLLGDSRIVVPSFLDVVHHWDFDEYRARVFEELEQGYDAGVFSAAVADYRPKEKREGKIPSGKGLDIEWEETPKVIKEVREGFPGLYMVTFKYEDGVSTDELLEIAKGRIQQGYQMVVANREQDMRDSHQAYLVRYNSVKKVNSSQEIARNLVDHLGEVL
jgi:phosphopantothenoylcysteine decarboxylase/phosphopantothenate--cysteine ligase